MQIHIAPLAHSYSEFLILLSKLEETKAHLDIDIVNWQRTEKQTISVEEALSVKTKLDLTFDLMLDYPTFEVEKLLKDERVKTIILNIDAKEDLNYLIDRIHFFNKTVGISINPNNKFYEIIPYIKKADLLQIFTVEPGAQGNPFLEDRLSLIGALRKFKFEGLIGVDGGVNTGNIKKIANKGADIVSVGSFITKAKDPVIVYKKLVNMMKDF